MDLSLAFFVMTLLSSYVSPHYVTHTQRVSVMVRRADTEVSPYRATERLLFEFFVLNSWNEHWYLEKPYNNRMLCKY